MDNLKFVNIYVERLRQIDDKLKDIDPVGEFRRYSELINEKKRIEDYLKDRAKCSEVV